MKNKLIKIILLCSLFHFGNAQELELKEIMNGNNYVGFLPQNPRWNPIGKGFFFDWNPKKEPGNSIYYWEKGMSAPQKADKSIQKWASIKLLKNPIDQQTFFVSNGNLFRLNNQIPTLVVQLENGISDVVFSNQVGELFFSSKNTWFSYQYQKGILKKIVSFSKAKTETQSKNVSFLEQQQTDLFKFIRDKKDKKEWQKLQEKGVETFEQSNQNIDFDWDLDENKIAPNGNYVVFRTIKLPENKTEVMQNFITKDGYNEEVSTKEKVSTNQFFESKLGIYNIKEKKTIYVDFSKLTDINKQPLYLKDYGKNDLNERFVIANMPKFNQKGDIAIVDVRSLDNKDRWILSLDLNTGNFTEIDHQHDEAWIGGPGIPSESFENGVIGFLNQREVYFQSEKTGFSHLYSYNFDSKKTKALTSGNWEVRQVIASKTANKLYIQANKTDSGNLDFYELNTNTSALTPILTQKGAHEVTVSEDEKTLLVRYSYMNKPWELYIADNKANTTLNQITYSQTDSFKKYAWKEPKIISFKAEDGTWVKARLYEAKKEKKNNAAVIFVHGAGYLQNAHNYWSHYFREYMFHNLLSDMGFTVLDIDYRASDGYGRDFRTGIYRFMGGKDLTDQIDGKKYLVENQGINPAKVGIYGGSYGGFMTLMALLTKPNEFKAGAALRSVTDWAHYNHGYTGNILNFPETDPEAYKKSSPIYFAENLQNRLLMLHGMVDDNVEYKDVVRLSQRFIELGKKNWELAVYPVESHGFVNDYSWYDEYSRILKLFTEELK